MIITLYFLFHLSTACSFSRIRIYLYLIITRHSCHDSHDQIINLRIARPTNNKKSSQTSMLGLMFIVHPWNSHRPSICPSIRGITRTRVHAFYRIRGKSRPGHTPFLFSHPSVLYFLFHAGIPTRTLYALLLKGASRFLLAILSRPEVSFLLLFLLSSNM